MSEFRYRHPERVAAPAPGEPPRRDSPYQRGGPEAGHTAAEDQPTWERSGGYDPDAEFKRPVAKPDGYLPDDTGGNVLTRIASRWRGDRDSGRGGPADQVEPNPRDGGLWLAPSGWGPTALKAPRPREAAEAAEADSGDTLRAVVDRPRFQDPADNRSPDRYGYPLTQPDGTQVPCFDGPPRREQTRQGWPGDCGIIAALGAVAAHRPEEIERRVRPREDGSYQVTLSEARENAGVATPTGRDIELTVTPELPVYNDDADTPACAKLQDGAAWCSVMEKAFAGLDQTWTAGRRMSWQDAWAELCAKDQADNAENPRSGRAPSGYARLHQGTTPWERAEVLTQLTGQTAVVREFPTGGGEWQINRIIRTQLADGKPVLVGSRPKAHEREVLPYDLKPNHVYEVTGIEKGKILLRNPWNRDHPHPMETDEFARNMSSYYSTLM